MGAAPPDLEFIYQRRPPQKGQRQVLGQLLGVVADRDPVYHDLAVAPDRAYFANPAAELPPQEFLEFLQPG
jgi:hypothetical protein